MLAVNLLRFASLAVVMRALGIESRRQNGRNLRVRYQYGPPPQFRPHSAPKGYWMWVGPPSQQQSKPEIEATLDAVPEPEPEPEPEHVAEYEIVSEVVEESEPEVTEHVSESAVQYEVEQVIEEPAFFTDYVLNEGIKEEAVVEEEIGSEEANYNTQITIGASLMEKSAADEGNTGHSTGAFVGMAAAVAAVAALALVALGRRRKKNNQEAEWESEDVEIGSENGYDNFVGDNEDVPPPSPPLPVDANANAWHQDNWHDEPSQEGVEIADLVEL